jgi:hypothetical protein
LYINRNFNQNLLVIDGLRQLKLTYGHKNVAQCRLKTKLFAGSSKMTFKSGSTPLLKTNKGVSCIQTHPVMSLRSRAKKLKRSRRLFAFCNRVRHEISEKINKSTQ